MPYFSRLTDIVTCSLTDLLAQSADPASALAEIVSEMEEGQAGARRSVATAAANVARLEAESEQQRRQIDFWQTQAKTELTAGDEHAARHSLIRRQEAEDVVAGLEQELTAARGTHEHLKTTLRALEARLADARRKRVELTGGDPPPDSPTPAAPPAHEPDRGRSVEDELEALRREIGG